MKKFSLIVLFSLFFNGCMVQNSYTNREQLMFISQTEEIKMGTQAESEILKKKKLSNNIKEKNRVENVGKKLATVANKPNYDWKFYLIEGDAINAFCLPGGKVFVYEGVLKIAKSDSELATVISHEIAHALLRHGAERMSIQQTANIVGTLLKTSLQSKNNPIINQNFDLVYGLAANVGVVLPYSRKHEFEADELGIKLMQKANYNTSEALTFWQRMMKYSNQEGLAFLSTHPSTTDRIENIKKIVQN